MKINEVLIWNKHNKINPIGQIYIYIYIYIYKFKIYHDPNIELATHVQKGR